MFDEKASICEAYTNSYILRPISVVAKFKQLSEPANTEEAKY